MTDKEHDQPITDQPITDQPITAQQEQLTATKHKVPADEIVEQHKSKLWAVLLCIPLIVIAADACLWQASGFFGPAVFLIFAVVIFGFSVPGKARTWPTVMTASMLIFTAWRLAWCGNALAMILSDWLLFAYCFSLRGQCPFVLRVFSFCFESMAGAATVVRQIEQMIRSKILPQQTAALKTGAIQYIFPAIAIFIFSGVFVMANADIVEVVSRKLSLVLESLDRFLIDLSVSQILFWTVVGALTAGILQPVIVKRKADQSVQKTDEPTSSPLYLGFRNTLISVIVIFGAYLLFELRAFTSGKPPEGFTYSSYAHEGAAWLTVALGLSTITLSLIFRGDFVRDKRYGRLERLAWGWSVLNFLLAVAVINRMWIYVSYNGMTMMRIVGFLGISAVLLGFILVLVKIHRRHEFRWLLRRQSWVAGLMLWILSVLPVDVLIHRYNVHAILNGNPAPIVQITAHAFSNECLNELVPLCDSDDPLVAAGIRQLLTERQAELEEEIKRQETTEPNDASSQSGTAWTDRQWYRASVLNRLHDSKAQWRYERQQTEQRDSEVASPLEELTTRAFKLYW